MATSETSAAIQINRVNRIVILLYLTMTTLTMLSLVNFDWLRDEQKQAIERQRQAMVEADRLIAGSKSLTDSVRAFAATGDLQHEQAYWNEVNQLRSRDQAETALRQMGLTDGETSLIERAKANSDQLIELEARAFKEGAQGNRSRAIELVFGADYRAALTRIYTPVEQFRERLEVRLKAEVSAAEARVQWWWNVILVLTVVNTLLVMFTLGVFYRRRVVLPLCQMNRQVRAILNGDDQDGERDRSGQPTSFAALSRGVAEIADLAKSFAVFQEVFRRAEDTRWIKTNVAEIGSALQQADNVRNLSQTAISRIAPTLGAGHGALYVAEGDGHYSLLGSYGYRERKHLNNRFAVGEGLVGQCAMEKTPITLSAPRDYIRINSGLGEAPPACIAVLPIMHQERVLAVLELAAFQPFSERALALLDELLPALATSLEIMDRNQRTKDLLQATREQAERMEKQAAQLEEQQVEMEAQQAELRETEHWFRSIIDASPDGLLVANDSGHILMANPTAERVLGFEPGELTGFPVDHLVPDATRSAHSGLRAAFLLEGRPRPMGEGRPLKAQRKDGSAATVDISLAPLPPRGAHGRCVAVTLRPH